VPTMIGATGRDLAIGTAQDADALFAPFGADAPAARRIYDPRQDEPFAELKQQVLADRIMVEPARHFADMLARAGRPVWLYRFGYVPPAMRGALAGAPHGFELPFVMNRPAPVIGADKVTAADRTMAELASGYWVAFAQTGDPNGGGRPAWPRHDARADRLLHFTYSGIIVGSDPLKARLDAWEKLWSRGHGK